METKSEPETDIHITAPNGVTWRRHAGATSSGPELLQALADLPGVSGDMPRQWNWWQEGRREQEHDALWRILSEWRNGVPDATDEEADAFAQAQMEDLDRKLEQGRRQRAHLVARSYDEDRHMLRRRLLRAESDAAFFAHVLQAPASPAQADEAQRRVADRLAAADEMRRQLGDPEQVLDRLGYLPDERRKMNLRSHTDYWRHPRLREWATTDRRRFNALLKMPMPNPGAMCSECQAPTEWHDYDLSLRLFHPAPAAGSQAETLVGLLPGWWERCPACTSYQLEHRWGGSHALPDFTGDQWIAMLPPMLRTIFAGTPPKPGSKRKAKPKPKPLAVIPSGPIGDVIAQLADAQAKHPTAQVRRGPGDSWELWPS